MEVLSADFFAFLVRDCLEKMTGAKVVYRVAEIKELVWWR